MDHCCFHHHKTQIICQYALTVYSSTSSTMDQELIHEPWHDIGCTLNKAVITAVYVNG
jgi:hypothetical protein